MRADAMTWVLRTVGAVFVIGVLALLAIVAIHLRAATGIPPFPILVGILGLVALILLAGACLALISLALSARRGVVELRRIAAQGGAVAIKPASARVFGASPLQSVVQAQPDPAITAPARPARPAGRNLVAER